MINKSNFPVQIDAAIKEITHLPTGDIKYYLLLLINSIKAQNIEQSHLFLAELFVFIDCLKNSTQNESTLEDDAFAPLFDHFCKLQNIAQTHTHAAVLKRGLLYFAAALTSILLGLIGGIIGAFAGFARGAWNYKPITGFFVGLLIGILMGGLFGFRIPIKLLENGFTRQLKFGLDGLKNSMNHLQESNINSLFNNKIRPFSAYLNEVQQELKAKFSTNEEYERFLESDMVFEIKSFYSSFIGSPMLHRYAGHHAYIKINIEGSKFFLEFTNEPMELEDIEIQKESRTVSGAKIIEMLAYHRKLLEKNTFTPSFIFKNMKPGDKDCFSYLNTILLGTNQNATRLKRFEQMSFVGEKVGQAIEYLSPFQPDFFNQIDLDLTPRMH